MVILWRLIKFNEIQPCLLLSYKRSRGRPVFKLTLPSRWVPNITCQSLHYSEQCSSEFRSHPQQLKYIRFVVMWLLLLLHLDLINNGCKFKPNNCISGERLFIDIFKRRNTINKYENRCPTPLIIRVIQIKITKRYHPKSRRGGAEGKACSNWPQVGPQQLHQYGPSSIFSSDPWAQC